MSPEQIKIELIKRNMSQRDLARELNLSPQLISGVLTGSIHSIPTLVKIITYLRNNDTATKNDTRTPTV